MNKASWQVESVRKTYFTTFDTKVEGLWIGITGVEPNEQTFKPSLGLMDESGQWKDRILKVTSQPGRVDITLNASLETFSLPNMGVYDECIGIIEEIHIPPSVSSTVTRVALGMVVLCPQGSHQEAYDNLGKILKHLKVSSSSRDFFYRINNPKISCTNSNMELNCISSWAAIRAVTVTVGGGNDQRSEEFAIRAELDISTSVENTSVITDQVEDYFREFFKIGGLILDEGPSS